MTQVDTTMRGETGSRKWMTMKMGDKNMGNFVNASVVMMSSGYSNIDSISGRPFPILESNHPIGIHIISIITIHDI
jgi:hypothetical protein